MSTVVNGIEMTVVKRVIEGTSDPLQMSATCHSKLNLLLYKSGKKTPVSFISTLLQNLEKRLETDWTHLLITTNYLATVNMDSNQTIQHHWH